MCITLVLPEAMATTQVLRAPSCRIGWAGPEEIRLESKSPRMNWVVVTDRNHNRRIQMRWAPRAE